MFQRQARAPFPIRNIILLAAIVLAFLFYLINAAKEQAAAPAPAPTEQPQ